MSPAVDIDIIDIDIDIDANLNGWKRLVRSGDTVAVRRASGSFPREPVIRTRKA